MPSLKQTSVYRGGATARKMSLETKDCFARVNKTRRTIELDFSIASKGGGTTRLSVQIGHDDIRRMLKDLANKNPDSVEIFAECTAIASKRNLALIAEARSLDSDLEVVREFVAGKYLESLSGGAQKEKGALTRILNVMTRLRRLG